MTIVMVGALRPEISASAILIRQLVAELDRRDDVNVSVVDVGGIRGGGVAAPWRYLRALGQMACLARRADVLCLYVNRTALPFIGPPAVAMTRGRGPALIIRTLGGKAYTWLRGLSRAISRWVVKRAGIYLVQTRALVEEVKADGIPHVEWYPNSRPMPDRPDDTPAPEVCRKFVHLGRLYEKKGIRDMIAAAERLPEEITVDVLGPFWYGDFGEEIFEGLQRVRYLGAVDPGDVPDVLQKYDALVLPTYDTTEGYPGVILEAFAAGIPIIATRVGGIPEILDDDCALLVEPHDVEGLLEAMKSLATDEDLCARLRVGSRGKRRDFSIERWTDHLLDRCRNVVVARTARGGA
jgi:glycosyltransferase involved in cell wall biosynthesis